MRPTSDVHQIVVAYPWRHRDRAEALGRAVAGVLDALPGADIDDAGQSRPPRGVAAAEPGPRPDDAQARGSRSSR